MAFARRAASISILAFCATLAMPGAGAADEARGTAIDVAVGGQMTCAAQPSGSVVCWGLDVLAHPAEHKFGVARPFPIAGLNGAKQLSVGSDSLCAVDGAGHLTCLGTLWFGHSGGGHPKLELDPIAQVAMSHFSTDGSHACAVRRDGRVVCWGSNGKGQLGVGDLDTHKDPVNVPGIADAVEVSVGNGFSCARQRTGAVFCWGRRLGLRDPQGDPLRPRKVPGVEGAVSLSSGGLQTCVARTDGSVVCWGHGAFGVPGRVQIDAPTDIPGVTGAVQVSVGAAGMACARTAASGVVCWGSGALGDGKMSVEAAPVEIPGLRDVVHVAVGATASCVLTTRGEVLCWGRTEMGDNGQAPQLQLASRPLLDRPHAAGLAAGDERTCFIGNAGDVRCRGPIGATSEPVRKLGPIAELAIALRHSCVRHIEGRVLCWGENDYGQLGDGTTIAHADPAPTDPSIYDARSIAATFGRTCAVRRTGALVCWGGGASQMNGPVPTGGFTDAAEVAMGREFVCVRRSHGEVACLDGRFGKRTGQPPTALPELSPAIAIAAREDQVCALRRDGVVACSGGGRGFHGWRGERNIRLEPLRLMKGGADAVAIAVGMAHGCLLRRGGTVACWGDGTRGQLGGPPTDVVATEPLAVPGIRDAREIVAGLDHTCARLASGEVRCWGYDDDGRLSRGAASLRPGPVALP